MEHSNEIPRLVLDFTRIGYNNKKKQAKKKFGHENENAKKNARQKFRNKKITEANHVMMLKLKQSKAKQEAIAKKKCSAQESEEKKSRDR